MSDTSPLPFSFLDLPTPAPTTQPSIEFRPSLSSNPFVATPASYAPPFLTTPSNAAALPALHALQGLIRIENATFSVSESMSNRNGPFSTSTTAAPVPATTSPSPNNSVPPPMSPELTQMLTTILKDVDNISNNCRSQSRALQDATEAMDRNRAMCQSYTDILSTIHAEQSAFCRMISGVFSEMSWLCSSLHRALQHHQPPYSTTLASFEVPLATTNTPVNRCDGNTSDTNSCTYPSRSPSVASTDGELLLLSDVDFDDHGYLINYRDHPTEKGCTSQT